MFICFPFPVVHSTSIKHRTDPSQHSFSPSLTHSLARASSAYSNFSFLLWVSRVWFEASMYKRKNLRASLASWNNQTVEYLFMVNLDMINWAKQEENISWKHFFSTNNDVIHFIRARKLLIFHTFFFLIFLGFFCFTRRLFDLIVDAIFAAFICNKY